MDRRVVLSLLLTTSVVSACGGMGEARSGADAAAGGVSTGMREARALLAKLAQQSGRPAYSPSTGVRFTPRENVFLKSTLAVDFTYRVATVTLPLFEGVSPSLVYRWRREAAGRPARQARPRAPRFVPLLVDDGGMRQGAVVLPRAPTQDTGADQIEVVLRNGRLLRVGSGTDAAVVARLAAALEA